MPTEFRDNRGQLSFEKLTRARFEQTYEKGKQLALEYAMIHNDNWLSRFGNLYAMTDANGGPAQPLAPKTIERKEHEMPLIDYSDVQEPPYLTESLFTEYSESELGPYHRVITAYSLIKNWKFPLNEWPTGGIVPARKTLGPTNVEISDNFVPELRRVLTGRDR